MKPTDYRFIVDSKTAGIPCKLGVIELGWFLPAVVNKDPDDCIAADWEEHTYDVLDRKGYKADWLFKKMSSKDERNHVKDIDNEVKRLKKIQIIK